MPTAVRRYIRSLGLDAYVVGGAVRDELLGIKHHDEDFLVPGVNQAGLRAALEPHGRVEDMEVHGQLVGVRFYPRDREIRPLVPAGIELTPPRAERSVGPGHRDFEIVADGSVSIEADMGRRDFTVNAIARRLETGELVDPFDGVAHLERRELRTVSPTSFGEDPLRILRGLRLVSQLGFTLPPETVEQMRADAHGLRHVSGERIGGGVAADGLGELSKLLLGIRPLDALRIARDTGALLEVVPEFAAVIGYDLGSPRQPVPLDEHLFGVAQAAADAGCAAPRSPGGSPPRPRQAGGGREPGRPRTARCAHHRPGHAAPAVPEHLAAGGRAARGGPRVLARWADRRPVRATLPRLERPPSRARAAAAQADRPRDEAGRSPGSSSISRRSSTRSRSSAMPHTGSQTSPSTAATCSRSATRKALRSGPSWPACSTS